MLASTNLVQDHINKSAPGSYAPGPYARTPGPYGTRLLIIERIFQVKLCLYTPRPCLKFTLIRVHVCYGYAPCSMHLKYDPEVYDL